LLVRAIDCTFAKGTAPVAKGTAPAPAEAYARAWLFVASALNRSAFSRAQLGYRTPSEQQSPPRSVLPYGNGHGGNGHGSLYGSRELAAALAPSDTESSS